MVKLLVFETVHQLRLFAHRPAALFFVIVMPVLLLVIFTEIFGNEEIPGQGITTARLYTPTLAVFGAVMGAYTYLAMATATARDRGVLKRLRGTPLPPKIDIAARIAAAGLIAIAAAAAIMACGMLLYSVMPLPEKLPAAILSLIVGILCFAALGMAVAALCRTAETAQAVANATILPVAFISDVFVRPEGRIPAWIDRIADIFPLKHLSLAFSDGFKPLLNGNGFAFAGDEMTYAVGQHLLVIGLWVSPAPSSPSPSSGGSGGRVAVGRRRDPSPGAWRHPLPAVAGRGERKSTAPYFPSRVRREGAPEGVLTMRYSLFAMRPLPSKPDWLKLDFSFWLYECRRQQRHDS